ncbi:MAG TPA: hypothetical protein VM492_15465 [Sumerlaeia bacterium]|nr:hypothetical protein [Sumerlaeia bacterium]
MKLWDRIHRGMEAGFDAALAAVHALTEKAGEGIELTLLRREKARCETRVTRLLAQLGNTVYEKISEKRLDDVVKQLDVKDIVLDVAREEAQIVDIDGRLGKELKGEGESESTDKKKEEKSVYKREGRGLRIV